MYYQDENGKKGLRIQFDLQGLRRQAICELDAREVSNFDFKTLTNLKFPSKFENISTLSVSLLK